MTQPPVRPDIHADPLRLASDRLSVEIDQPGRQYARQRFDWSAFITKVKLDGQYDFCVPEAIDGTGTGGIGLCSEFGIHAVPGHDDIAPGQRFIKPGVGILTRLDERPYGFGRPYPIEPFQRQIEAIDGGLRFITLPSECNGYAVRLERTVRVQGNRLRVESTLQNVGRKPYHIDEYCHNFVALGGSVNGGLTMRWSRQAKVSSVCPEVKLDADQVTWQATPSTVYHIIFDVAAADTPGQDWWELRDPSRGLVMRETTSERWSRIGLFGTPRLVSPEAFVDINLQPGQAKQWWREYEFSRL